MKASKVLTTVASVAVIVAVLTPHSARAGDREWATAGKILTGVVAASILHDSLSCDTVVRRPVVVERRVVRDYHYRPSHHRRYSSRPVVQVYRYESRPVTSTVVYRTPAAPPLQCTNTTTTVGTTYNQTTYSPPPVSTSELKFIDGGVVKYLTPTRRVYQPMVEGHAAEVQERPYVGHPWMKINNHPSIW